ncbi:hypothetical protein [Spiroplasma taiwanense]|uniref:Uncharacterized protein n=1 Tax=Spiroplasma taiwanense CT-1 TaxID=1276220 RepID=S5MH12_9MOLU|nr:hypothetical protein [Spiroplasma taiwanense]AGR41135.1 hypothetical protein STAIW_v1c04930 [Spiroplasma taiwanense CT-1]
MAMNKEISKKTKKNVVLILKEVGDEKKMFVGRKVQRPSVLKSNYNRVELAKQTMLNSKKGKNVTVELPVAIQDSVKNKERIENILNLRSSNSPEDIRKKLSIETKPLTKKRAEELKEERIAFFQANIKKNQKEVSLTNSKSKRSSVTSQKVNKESKKSKTTKANVTSKKTVAKKK